jgi:hypothetical protein
MSTWFDAILPRGYGQDGAQTFADVRSSQTSFTAVDITRPGQKNWLPPIAELQANRT